ncbi:hypothetical protein FHR90_003100 [Endobacter medicaginis]|nr:hypothetical protein [Endobacter medicaginis]MBB3175246.1 hypothetical protein [Endobacter medicaginis]MCX5476270.1 hypothetical protein [Endobacter medicaginis]
MTTRDEDRDFFFGGLTVTTLAGVQRAEREFISLVEIFKEKVSAEAFTRHLRRIVQKYGRFLLTQGHSNAPLEDLITLIDVNQVDLARIYTWQAAYKFFGVELVFHEGVVELQSCWTYDGSHQRELEECFLNPLKRSGLFRKLIVNNGGDWVPFEPGRLRFAQPDPHIRRQGEPEQ